MTDRIDVSVDDTGLELELRELAGALALPQPSTGFAAAVTARIEREAPRRERAPLVLFPRIRRGILLAVAAALVLAAAAAAAIGWRLPGLDILFGTPSVPVPTPSLSPGSGPGALLGLGTSVSLDEARRMVDFDILLPGNPDPGLPDATYVRLGRVAMVWAPRPGIPATTDSNVGLLLNEFRGGYDETVVEKLIHEGTEVESVTVAGARGYWIAGAPHFFVYIDESGQRMEDTYRSVGQTLVWFRDEITYRLETGLDRDAAIDLAESIR